MDSEVGARINTTCFVRPSFVIFHIYLASSKAQLFPAQWTTKKREKLSKVVEKKKKIQNTENNNNKE